MSRDDGKQFVNVLFDSDHMQDLDDIQAFYGIMNRSEVIRMLVRAEVRRINTDAPMFVSGGRRDNLS